MNINRMMAAFAAFIIAGRVTAADTPLPITNITVNDGNVTLQWETPLGRTPDNLRLEESNDLVIWDVVDNVKAPKNIDGTTVSVGAEPKKFFRLFAEDAMGDGDLDEMWSRVSHTIVINLTNNYAVTRLPADFDVTNDPGSKTDHLYLRYITKTPDGKPDQMGSLVAEDQPWGVTNLNLSGYYIGVYAVTEAQYRHVTGGDPIGLTTPTGDDRPVTQISYNEIRSGLQTPYVEPTTAPTLGSFLGTLSDEVYKANNGLFLAFDLPTEAQWEVACRAGTIGTFNNTNAAMTAYEGTVREEWTPFISEVAWWVGNETEGNAAYGSNVARPVGLKRANRAGLYDMHGNVVEWCLDSEPFSVYDAYPAVDGGDQPALGLSNRSLRGGQWRSMPSFIRSANRYTSYAASTRNTTFGFRICARGEEVPDPDEMWSRVSHTIVINLTNNYAVTRLPADFCVTNDPASKTDHLYLRYITATPLGTPDQMGSLVAEGSPYGVTNLNLSGYYIGVYAVTEAQYRHVMDGYDPPGLANPTGDDRPVAMITYNDIRKQDDPGTAPSSGGFLWALSNKVDTLGGVSLAFDLPTEAQWEVACRAGTVGTFNNTDLPLASYTGFDASWTNRINEVAWWIGNLAEGDAAYGSYVARPVGLKRANRAGLYDMHGNVVEWCLDSYPTSLYYDAYPAVGGGDQPVLGGSTRSQRGGYWSSITASFIRSAERGSTSAYTLSWYIGFRVCARGEEVSEP